MRHMFTFLVLLLALTFPTMYSPPVKAMGQSLNIPLYPQSLENSPDKVLTKYASSIYYIRVVVYFEFTYITTVEQWLTGGYHEFILCRAGKMYVTPVNISSSVHTWVMHFSQYAAGGSCNWSGFRIR